MTRKSISSQLLDCGAVKQREPARKKQGNCPREESLDWFPKNRLGRPVVWAKWILRKRLPKDVKRTCCLCGKRHSKRSGLLSPSKKLAKIIRNESKKETGCILNIETAFVCSECKEET